MSAPHVAAVVLDWNRPADTLACLNSVARCEHNSLSLIAVDNGSSEPSGHVVAERFPDAVTIRNTENLGFAGGMNVGLDRALELGADYVLLLNNDTVVAPTAVSLLVEAAAARPDAGIVSPLVLSREAPGLALSAGWEFDPRRGHPGRPLLSGRDAAKLSGVREVIASSGEAMLVSAAAARQVGPLDESLYLRLEDVDWSLRMRAADRRNYVSLDARIWHAVSASSGGDHSPLSAYYHTRNVLVVCDRHAPLSTSRARLREAEVVLANLAHARRGTRPLDNARAVLAGWSDYRRGRLGRR